MNIRFAFFQSFKKAFISFIDSYRNILLHLAMDFG